jgi:hypothetical protein
MYIGSSYSWTVSSIRASLQNFCEVLDIYTHTGTYGHVMGHIGLITSVKHLSNKCYIQHIIYTTCERTGVILLHVHMRIFIRAHVYKLPQGAGNQYIRPEWNFKTKRQKAQKRTPTPSKKVHFPFEVQALILYIVPNVPIFLKNFETSSAAIY